MGLTKHLTKDEKEKIQNLKQQGVNCNQIAKIMGRNRSTITRFIASANNPSLDNRGRAPSISNRMLRRVMREISKKPCSASYLKKVCGIKAHVQTLRNALRKRKLSWNKCMTSIGISKRNRIKRLTFSKKNLTNWINWKEVIFTDEKSFSLDGLVNSVHGWSAKNNKPVVIKRHSRGGSVMVWGAITYNGTFRLCFIDGTLDGTKYVDILKCKLRGLLFHKHIFQHDNCPAHKSKKCTKWFQDNDLNVLIWPPQSPDLNIIENVWAFMSNIVYENGRQYYSKTELRREIFKAWNKLDIEYIQGLFRSVPSRLVQCMNKNGGKTKY